MLAGTRTGERFRIQSGNSLIWMGIHSVPVISWRRLVYLYPPIPPSPPMGAGTI